MSFLGVIPAVARSPSRYYAKCYSNAIIAPLVKQILYSALIDAMSACHASVFDNNSLGPFHRLSRSTLSNKTTWIKEIIRRAPNVQEKRYETTVFAKADSEFYQVKYKTVFATVSITAFKLTGWLPARWWKQSESREEPSRVCVFSLCKAPIHAVRCVSQRFEFRIRVCACSPGNKFLTPILYCRWSCIRMLSS